MNANSSTFALQSLSVLHHDNVMRSADELQYRFRAMKRENKTVSLTIRVTPSVKQLVERLAADDGRSVASYIERLILRADGDETRGTGKPDRTKR